MKNVFRILGVIAIVAVIGFSFAACGGDDGGGGGGTGGDPRTVTYSGTASGNTYTLKIIENKNNPNRAVLNDPKAGDNFEFTWTDSSNATKKSTGEVKTVSGNEFTMLPSNAATPQTTFTTTVSDEGLTAMSGTFTWTDGTTGTGSGTLTPSGGPGTVTPPVTSGGWTAVDVSNIFGDTSIYAIAYGNNKFVAGGFGGTMAYSADGKTWTVTDSKFGNTGSIFAIAYGNNKFVAVGGGKNIVYSSDGITWTAADLSTYVGFGVFNAIAYGNEKFVVGDSYGKIVYSSDGITWAAVADSKLDGIKAIAYGNGKFVAGGEDGKMAYSSDGITWTAVADSKFGDGFFFSPIVYGNKFVAVGYSVSNGSGVSYSSDGITWTRVTNSSQYSIDAIAYGNNKFVAVGGFSSGSIIHKIATSSDGITWTPVTSTFSGDYNYDFSLTSIAYGNGTFVAGGTDKSVSPNKVKIGYSTGN